MKNPVGVSLLAIAVCQFMHSCLTLRLREQARSHLGFMVGQQSGGV